MQGAAEHGHPVDQGGVGAVGVLDEELHRTALTGAEGARVVVGQLGEHRLDGLSPQLSVCLHLEQHDPTSLHDRHPHASASRGVTVPRLHESVNAARGYVPTVCVGRPKGNSLTKFLNRTGTRPKE